MKAGGMPRPWTSRQRLAASALAVMLLHGLVLAWAQPGLDGEAQAPGLPGRRSVQLRLVSMPGPAEQLAPPPSAIMSEGVTGEASPEALDMLKEGDHPVGLEGYVPRRWLTVAPEALAPILLPFPESFQDNAHYTAVLNLFIETDGRVSRVEFVGMALPDALARAARSTFERARFTPGQVKGRIVKSLIKIEVDFDNLGRG